MLTTVSPLWGRPGPYCSSQQSSQKKYYKLPIWTLFARPVGDPEPFRPLWGVRRNRRWAPRAHPRFDLVNRWSDFLAVVLSRPNKHGPPQHPRPVSPERCPFAPSSAVDSRQRAFELSWSKGNILKPIKPPDIATLLSYGWGQVRVNFIAIDRNSPGERCAPE